MYEHQTKVRVRYGETDQMGVVYYGNYALYYEIGRVEWLRSLGVSYSKMEKELGVMLPVTQFTCRYLRPAVYDEELTIVSTVKQMPTDTIHFEVSILNLSNKVINRGQVSLCFIDMKTKKRTQIPTLLKNGLEPYFEE